MIIEAVVFGVVLMAIGLWWRLNNKVQDLRSLAAILGPVQKQLRDTLNNISGMLGALQKAVQSNHEDLTVHAPQGQSLKEELSVLVEHGEKISMRLDKLLEQADNLEQFLKKNHEKSKEKNDNIIPLVERKTVAPTLSQKNNVLNTDEPPSKNFKDRLKELR